MSSGPSGRVHWVVALAALAALALGDATVQATEGARHGDGAVVEGRVSSIDSLRDYWTARKMRRARALPVVQLANPPDDVLQGSSGSDPRRSYVPAARPGDARTGQHAVALALGEGVALHGVPVGVAGGAAGEQGEQSGGQQSSHWQLPSGNHCATCRLGTTLATVCPDRGAGVKRMLWLIVPLVGCPSPETGTGPRR